MHYGETTTTRSGTASRWCSATATARSSTVHDLLDVIGHELTHGVTEHEAGLAYQGQSGALNESISDVFGSLVKQHALGQTADQADWLIGAGLLAAGVQRRALRSMKAPGTAYDDPGSARTRSRPTWTTTCTPTDDNGGVHINSGIPNRAFYLLARVGRPRVGAAGRSGTRRSATPSSTPPPLFQEFAQRTAINAGAAWGTQSAEAGGRETWSQVEIQVG